MKTLDVIVSGFIGLVSLTSLTGCMTFNAKSEDLCPQIRTQYDEESDKNFGYCFKNYHIVEEIEDLDDEQTMYESSTIK